MRFLNCEFVVLVSAPHPHFHSYLLAFYIEYHTKKFEMKTLVAEGIFYIEFKYLYLICRSVGSFVLLLQLLNPGVCFFLLPYYTTNE